MELATIERPAAPYARHQDPEEHGDGDVYAKQGTYASSEAVLQDNGLDWSVGLKAMSVTDSGLHVPNFKAVVREDTGTVLGVRTDIYKPIQNRDAFSFLDSLYDDGLLTYTGAGSFRGGSNVWIEARLNRDMRIGDDTYAQFLVAVTSHNGDRSLTVYATDLNLWCTNQLNRIARNSKETIYVRHSGDVTSKMAKAREVFRITDEAHRRMEEFLTQSLEVEVDEPSFLSVREKLFGALDDATPTQRRNAIDAFTEIYRVETERHGETAYSLINAVTGYADHKIRVQKDGSRMASELSGRIATFKNEGLTAIRGLVPA